MHVPAPSRPRLLLFIVTVAALLALAPALVAYALTGTATLIQLSPNPAPYGQYVYVTATVNSKDPANCDTPTGDVVLRDGTTALMTQTLDINASTVFTVPTSPNLQPGSHSLSARYLGDMYCPLSASSSHSLTVKVTTYTFLGFWADPTVYGQSATLQANVGWNGPFSDPYAQTVTFFDNGNPLGTTGLQVDPQYNQWYALLISNTLSVGDHPIVAQLNGSGTQFSSADGPYMLTVHQAGTSLALASAPNPSYFRDLVAITATAAITAPGAGTLSGCVNWYDNGAQLGGCGGFDANNHAVLYAGVLAPGTHSLVAQYAGNANFAGSTTSVLLQIVNPDTTTTLQAAPNPSGPGQTAYFTVTVAAVNGTQCASPAGTIDLKDNGSTLATQDLSGGQTTFAVSSLSVGTHSISAAYRGDGTNCSASLSSAQPQLVNWRLFLPLLRR